MGKSTLVGQVLTGVGLPHHIASTDEPNVVVIADEAPLEVVMTVAT